MKKIIALILFLCMTLGMVVSASATSASSFSRTLNLVRLIRAMFAKDDDPEFGELEDGKLIVYVSPKGKADASGTEKSPMTIEAARDAARTVDKKEYDGIDIVLQSGNYVVKEAITLTAEDAGTKNCPVRYIGEDGATIVGGVALTASDFAPATGSAVQYFPEEAKANIVQYDLKALGYTKEDIAATLRTNSYTAKAIRLFSNGEMQTIARYPNGDEQITILDGAMWDKDGNVTDNDGNQRPNDPDLARTYVAYIDEEHIQHALTWHNPNKVYLYGYVDLLWRVDHTTIRSIDDENNMLQFPFPGTSAPSTGRSFYLYNIPEELDYPGEYYIDDDAILYYYPDENFKTATLSIPLADLIFDIQGADYTTFENLTIETSAEDGIKIRANNVTLYDCVIRGMIHTAVDLDGFNNTISTCHIYNTGSVATIVVGGDPATMTPGNNLLTNCYIHDFGIIAGGYNGACNLSGYANIMSHNEAFGSDHMAVHLGGTDNVIEYNYFHDLCLNCDDMGAIYGSGVGTITRYNYFKNIGPNKENRIKEYKYMGAHALYHDFGTGMYSETYGNVFEEIYGAAVWVSGRTQSVHDNLFISCTWNVEAICSDYAIIYNGGSASKSFDDFYYNDLWKAKYPLISQLVTDSTKTTADDPLLFCYPAGVEIYDNYSYGDKNNSDYRGIVSIEIENHIMNYSGETIEDMTTNNGMLTIFNSRRDGFPEIKEALETASGTIDLTYEQFCEIGINWEVAE